MTGIATGRSAGLRCRRLFTLAVAIAAAAGLFATSASADAKLAVTMTHANAYGFFGGVEPFALNARTFARESAGNVYEITVTNVGDEAFEPNAAVVLSDHLPAGLTLDRGIDALLSEGWVECAVITKGVEVPASAFQCRKKTTAESPKHPLELAPGASYPTITAQVAVSANAAEPATNVATVKNTPTVSVGGEEVASVGEEESETLITPAVPFGITSFATRIGEFKGLELGEELEWYENGRIKELEQKFTPDSQAGSHPPSLASDLLFNYTFNAAAANKLPSWTPAEESREGTLGKLEFKVESAGGKAKEVQVETPPGFVGDVIDKPRCPLFVVQAGSPPCAEDTAVGYTTIGVVGDAPDYHEDGHRLQLFRKPGEGFTSEGKFVNTFEREVINDPDRSLVYNVQPAPGSVAAFAFNITSGLTFLLEVHVRTDGDYGITVGTNAAGGDFAGANVTMCEFGAEGSVRSAPLGFKCKGEPSTQKTVPIVKPFLTNPSKCEGPAPVWRAFADPWVNPTGVVTKSGEANVALERRGREVVSASPTDEGGLVTGCENLRFEPAIEFAPSAPAEGGTTQPDTPTAATFNLTVPQEPEEANKLATPALRDITTTLPEGMTASPSAADGLEACTNAQFGLGTEFETPGHPLPPGVKPTEPANAASCPPASQIGTAEVRSPLLTGAPIASGPQGGAHVVSCSEGQWTSAKPTLSYAWLRNGKPIEGADRATYSLLEEGEAAELPNAIQCAVTAKSAAGSSVAVSVPAYPEGGLPFPPANMPRLSAQPEPKPGETLTCPSGAWTSTTGVKFPSPMELKFSYQWLRNGEPISGASTGETTAPTFPYTLTSEDAGKAIQCQVTGTNTAGKAIADTPAVVVSPIPAEPAIPLPGAALKGEVFLGQPECSPCGDEDARDGKLFRLFLQLKDPRDGLIVRSVGHNEVNTSTGRITSVFEEQPQQPFEMLQLKLHGGPRAPLATPQACGPAVTEAKATPWSAAAGEHKRTEPEEPEKGSPKTPVKPSTFTVGVGESCAASFLPSFNAGTAGPTAATAGAYTNFALTFGRNDREQDLAGVTVHMPLGLVGKIAGVPECGQAEIAAAENNSGECPSDSAIGTATAVAGSGTDPFATGGHVYFTGPTKLANGIEGPFGLAVVTLAKAGPFNLGNVVVRSAIQIDPNTAAITVTSDPLPQIVHGVPVRLRQVNVNVTRQNFMLNPTNCAAQRVQTTLTSAQGTGAQVSSPFGISGCKNLGFHPTFTATTQANSSKVNGASLDVKIGYPPGSYANIAKSVTELPTALPSRLTTLQKACPDSTFNANPASCPEAAVVGMAVAHTPLLSKPLAGPAYLVSHGGAKYPDLEIILQGEGVKVVLDGSTEITKGITKTSFESVPDSPVESFELNLPEGPHSVLGANGDLCTDSLNLPTVLTGQNGAVTKQITKVNVTGCPLTVAIKAVKIKGNAALVTVTLSAKGTVKINGNGLRTTTKKNLAAGTHQIRVALTKKGRSLRSHHRKATLHVKLTVAGKPAAAKSTSVKL